MQHYVLFKLEPDYSADEMQELFQRTYTKIPAEIEAVNHVGFHRNVICRDCNMDVMIDVNCSEEGLYQYLAHPLHKEFAEATKEHIALRVSFDCTEEM